MKARICMGAMLAGASIASMTVAHAQDHDHDHDEHDEEPRAAGAHVHGTVFLAMAADGDELAIELQSAMHNIVGFERTPETDEERDALAAARTQLADGAALFEPSAAAGCAFEGVESTLAADHDEHGDHEDHDDHEDHGADEHHDDHDEEHGDHEDGDHDDHAHSDVTATYTFHCDAPDALRSIRVGLFAAFERIETIEATFLGEGVQTAADLTPEGPVFDLR